MTTGRDYHAIFDNPLDAECVEGYIDGRNPDSPEPSTNRHPAYIHGFRNGRDDSRITPRRETAQQRRETWDMIVAMCKDEL